MAPERRIDVLVPGGSIRPVRSALRERDAGPPARPLGVPWGRLLLVLAVAIGLWVMLGEAAVALLD